MYLNFWQVSVFNAKIVTIVLLFFFQVRTKTTHPGDLDECDQPSITMEILPLIVQFYYVQFAALMSLIIRWISKNVI